MGFIFAALDESSDKSQREVFVVAGYLARQAEWTAIEGQWMRRLERESMNYFSTYECNTLTGEFLRFRDPHKYPKPQGRLAADSVRDDLQLILRAASAIGFGLGVNLKKYRAVRKSSRARKALGSNPYEQMYLMMMIIIAGACEDQWPGKAKTKVVAYLCDQHDRCVKVQAAYDKLKDNNPVCAEWMGSLTFMDNEKSAALQAADLLAARCRQFLTEQFRRPGETAPLVERYKEIFGRNVGIRCMDKRSLEVLVDANVLKDGKPSIYSTQQLSLFRDAVLGRNK